MPIDFENLKYDEAATYIKNLKDEGYLANKDFYNEEHWQAGKGWIGPKGDNSAAVLATIRDGFVSKNVVKEVVKRHRGAVVGHEPKWAFTLRRSLAKDEQPTNDEKTLIDDAGAALTEQWDDSNKEIHEVFKQAVKNLLLGKRAVLRILVPPAFTAETGGRIVIPQGDLSESLSRIFLEAIDPDQSGVLKDTDTMRPFGVYTYKRKIEKEEIQFAEVHHLDDDGNTLIRVIQSDDRDSKTTDPLPLNGRLMMFELKSEGLITEQFRKNQALLNLALTMLARNVVLGGFLERVILNAQMPGQWVDDTDHPGKKVFEPSPYYTGGGTTNFLQGSVATDNSGNPIADQNGRPVIASPSVVYRDPVDVKTFTDTKAEAYANMLEEAQQVHALISKDATASGESRIQALADFIISIRETAGQLAAAGRWYLETTLLLGAVLSNDPRPFGELRAEFKPRIDVGPVPVEMLNAVMSLVKARLNSVETAMYAIGVDDPDAEKIRIKSDDLEFAPPIQQIQTQRAQIGLQADKRATDKGIADRIATAGAGQGSDATLDATGTQAA